MSKYKKITWESSEENKKFRTNVKRDNNIDTFIEMCQKLLPKEPLLKSCDVLEIESTNLRQVNKKIIEKIAKQPFLASFIVWVKSMSSTRSNLINIAQNLLKNGYIGTTDKKGATWSIENAHKFDHTVIIDAIRCNNKITLQMRENLVESYLSFIQWLSEETNGYVTKLEDPDLIKVMGKILPHSSFITFITALSNKDQLVAKLLYYGGTPTLDEVLNIQLEDIDFKKHLVHYKSKSVSYPTHVLADIQLISGKKKTGRLFVGRQNSPMSSSKIFRNFKKAANETRMEDSFSPATLTSSR